MTEHPVPPRLSGAITAMLAEAEQTTSEIVRMREALALGEVKRRKLLTAIDSAMQALPDRAREDFAARMTRLATAMTPKRGRRPDTRQQAIIEYLGQCAHYDHEIIKVAEVQAHLERLGYERLPHGYASNALARLAEQGFVTKVRFARYRVNEMHPELVTLRFKLLDAEVAQSNAREQEIKEAEKRGRLTRPYGPRMAP